MGDKPASSLQCSFMEQDKCSQPQWRQISQVRGASSSSSSASEMQGGLFFHHFLPMLLLVKAPITSSKRFFVPQVYPTAPFSRFSYKIWYFCMELSTELILTLVKFQGRRKPMVHRLLILQVNHEKNKSALSHLCLLSNQMYRRTQENEF